MRRMCWRALRYSLPIRPLPVRLKANGETYEGQYVFGAVCNSTSLGGMLKLDPGVVDMNDGLFETLLVKMPTNAMELQDILTALTTRRYENRMLTFIRSNRLVFEVDKEMPWIAGRRVCAGRG